MIPGYDIKEQQVVEFRCGIMRLLVVTTISGSPLGKLLYLLAYPKTLQVLGCGVKSPLWLGGGLKSWWASLLVMVSLKKHTGKETKQNTISHST